MVHLFNLHVINFILSSEHPQLTIFILNKESTNKWVYLWISQMIAWLPIRIKKESLADQVPAKNVLIHFRGDLWLHPKWKLLVLMV